MRFQAASIIAGTLLLCLHGIKAQSVSGFAASDNSFTRSSRLIPAQARRIESALDERLRTLANVICHEQIARYAKKGSTTSQIDSLDVNVEVLEGVEKYSDIRRREKMYTDMQELPGTWSVGEMATLLSSTRDAIEQGNVQVSQAEAPDLGSSSVVTFRYAAESRRWYIKANSRLHWLSFEGRVWCAPDSGEIRRISWVANDLPADSGAAEVLWTVDFSRVNLSPLVVSLPEKALFQVTYRAGADRVDWNVTRFSDYRRYGTETAIHFDE